MSKNLIHKKLEQHLFFLLLCLVIFFQKNCNLFHFLDTK